MILVPANKVEKIKYFSTLLGLIFIEITRGPFDGVAGPGTRFMYATLQAEDHYAIL